MILVTGGSGFIGKNFINHVLNKTDSLVCNIDKLTYASRLFNDYSPTIDSRLSNERIDICNYEELKNHIYKIKPELIVNFAAETHVDRSIGSPDDFIDTNIIGTFNLLKISKSLLSNELVDKNQFKFIQVSTDEVYGALGNDDPPFTEKNKYYPSSPYSASKASADHLVYSFFKTYEFPAMITNCSNNYGPFQHTEKLIPLTIISALKNEKIPIYGDGMQVRDWIYVDDHCDGIYNVCEKGKIGENYNLGSNNEKPNIEVITQICSILDELKPRKNPYIENIAFVKDRLGHDFRYAIDSSKANNELQWAAKTDFNVGLRKTIEWYLEYFKQSS